MSLDGAGVVGKGDASLRVGRVPRCYEFFFFQEAVSRLSFENAQHVHEISGQSTFLANLVPDICFLLFICEREREILKFFFLSFPFDNRRFVYFKEKK